jgi:hypothetical protein
VKRIVRVLGFMFSSFLLFNGCAELGQLGRAGGYGNLGGNELVGEVQIIDTRARQIQLTTDTGRRLVFMYDNNTRVSYRQRDYTVADLEPGDYVALRAQQDRDGRNLADLITVRESLQERTGYSGGGTGRGNENVERLDRLEGQVEFVDVKRGLFEIRNRQNRLVVVALPKGAPRSISERFNRLREGDYVRLEGRFLNQDRFELENFA